MSGFGASDPVEEALACGYDDMCAVIARFATAEALDHFSRRCNVNDGFEPLHCVIRHCECDAGTALCIYWQFHELLGDPSARADTDREPARWNAHALLTQIERRYPDGFRHHGIACDPMADCMEAFGPGYIESIRARHVGSPLMEPMRITP